MPPISTEEAAVKRWIDHDQDQRRLESYQDISRSAFALGMIALGLVAVFAIIMMLPEGWRHG